MKYLSFLLRFICHGTIRYDMDSIKGIQSIPVPAIDYNDTGDDLQDAIYYILQKKATEHKKNGNMDLAIECLRKSNDLSDYYTRPQLTQVQYLRLVKFLEKVGRPNEAEKELNKIKTNHPEFFDVSITNKKRLLEEIESCKTLGLNMIALSTMSNCEICGKYNKKVYSLDKLPKQIFERATFECNHYVSFCTYFPDDDDILSPRTKRLKK